MAISKEQLTVEVVLDSSGAIKGIKDLQGQFVEFDKVLKTSSNTTKTANDNTSKLSQSIGSMSSFLSKAALPLLAVQTAVNAVTQVFGTLSSALGSFVNDYAAAEKAQTLLSQAIENSNGRILNSATAWGEYLDQLQEVKAVDADVLRGLVAQAVQMGFSEEQIKNLASATIGLSKVTGDSLEGSFQRLIGTTRGMARGLSAMVPELQNLTQEQLRSGDAFEIVANKYKNAADGAGSYSYSVKQAGLAAGELSEDIGKAITEVFNLKGVMETATSVINGVRAAIAGVDFASLGRNFAELVSNAGPVLVFITGLTAALTGLSPVILGVVAPIAVLTAKLLAIVAAVTAVVTVIEMLATNFGIVENVIAIAANGIALAVISMVRNVSEDLGKLFSLFGADNPMAKAFNQITAGLQKSVENLKSNISKNTSEIKSTFDKTFTADLFKQAGNAIDSFRGKSDATTTSLTKLGQTGARTKVIDEKALEKADAALKEIVKQTDALNLATKTSGADEITQLQQKGAEQLRLIDLKQKELEQQGLLNNKLKAALADQRAAVVANTQKSIETEKQNKLIEHQKKLNSELTNIVNSTKSAQEQIRMSNLGTFDVIKAQSATELEKITALEKQLELAGGLTAEKKAEIEATKQGIKEIESARTGQAIMSGVNSALSAAQGGADALVGNIITQIGDAFGAEGKMIAGAINLLRKGGEFTKQLGKELFQIIKNLPKMISEGAVGLIEGLVEGFISLFGDPKATEQFINNLVNGAAAIISALAKATPILVKVLANPKFWLDVAIAFVKAIVDVIPDIFKSLFGEAKELGGFFLSPIKEAFSSIFDFFGNIGNFVVDGFKKGVKYLFSALQNIPILGDLLTGMWEGTVAVFKGIGNYFTKVFEGVKGIFNSIIEVFKQLFEGAKNIFMSVWNAAKSIFSGIGKALGAVFKFVVELFTKPLDAFKNLGERFSQIFQNVADAFGGIFSTVGNFFSDLWEAIKAVPERFWNSMKESASALWDTLANFGARVWEGLKNALGDAFQVFKNLGNAIKDGLAESFDWIADKFRNFGRYIWEGLKAIIKETVGKLAEWLGLAEGGIVPGTARVAGDSAMNDVVPAMLSPGEAVIPRSLMANPQINQMIKDLLNNRQISMSPAGDVPRVAFANGGMVPALVGATSYGDTNLNVVLQIETKEPLDEGFIRQRLMPALKAELKASSLRGDFILSAKGVRG